MYFPLRVSCGPARCLPVRPGRDVICWFRFKKGIFLTVLDFLSVVNAAELLPLVVKQSPLRADHRQEMQNSKK